MAVYFYDLEQNTTEWNEARGGIVTASSFGNVVSPSAFKPSASRNEYIGKVLSHGVEDEETFYGERMEEGHRREDESIADYELLTGNKTHKCGIIYQNHSFLASCSPDALIGENGGLEVKNPMLKTHIKYMLDDVIPAIYRPQVYASLVISGREWWDFVSYHPNARSFIKRATVNDVMNVGTGKNKKEVRISDLVAEQLEAIIKDTETARKKVFF